MDELRKQRSADSASGLYRAGTIWHKDEKRSDIYLAKTDAEGNLVWVKTFGGEGTETSKSNITDSDKSDLLSRLPP